MLVFIIEAQKRSPVKYNSSSKAKSLAVKVAECEENRLTERGTDSIVSQVTVHLVFIIKVTVFTVFIEKTDVNMTYLATI